MKYLLAATAGLALSTTAAMANDLVVVGQAEYAIEAEEMEAKAGVEYSIENLTFVPLVVVTDTPETDMDFSGVELNVSYAVNENVAGYVEVELDDELDHTETTVGVAVRF